MRYLDPRALRKIENLRLAARGVVEGFISGLHKSPYHGFSVEFSEYRKYAPGDDLKHFDWKAYAKTDVRWSRFLVCSSTYQLNCQPTSWPIMTEAAIRRAIIASSLEPLRVLSPPRASSYRSLRIDRGGPSGCTRRRSMRTSAVC